MHPTSRFEATMPTQLHALISDLRWRLRMIDADILEEERKAESAIPRTSPTPCSRTTCGLGARISG